jgi:hypothetical protein
MAARLAEQGTEIFIDGPGYHTVLSQIHQVGRPKSYFEIGAFTGDTLALSRCKTVAVDPVKRVLPEVERGHPNLTFREMTSDDYFARHSPVADLGRRIDLAFLDGMHEFDFLLRDFINTERLCHPGSIIALHDCLPRDAYMTRPWKDWEVVKPTHYPNHWTGDVWKMVVVLRQHRPDLDLRCLDAPPTGLTVCRGLDPANTVLADNYDRILADWRDVILDDYGIDKLFAVAAVESAEAWMGTVAPFHRSPLRDLGAKLQPRRRLLKALRWAGLRAA